MVAAHCFNKFEEHYYEVRAGMLRRKSFAPMTQIVKISHVYPHPEYERKTSKDLITIAIIISFTPHFQCSMTLLWHESTLGSISIDGCVPFACHPLNVAEWMRTGRWGQRQAPFARRSVGVLCMRRGQVLTTCTKSVCRSFSVARVHWTISEEAFALESLKGEEMRVKVCRLIGMMS